MKPFDLEKALQGEPVVLRDGTKAYVLKKLDEAAFERSALIGYSLTEKNLQEVASWYETGKWINKDVEYSMDIVGMWEDPPKMFVTPDGVELPLPMQTPPDGFFYVVDFYNFEVICLHWNGSTYDYRNFNRGNCFSNKEDALAWADYFKGLLKKAKDTNDN